MNLKKLILIVFTILISVFLLPASADAAEITVGTGGSYDHETLAAAVSAAASGDTITVMTNLTMTERAYISDKHLTIKGNTPDITITRGSGFRTASDTARGWFNPGMLEVAVSNPGNLAVTSSVTLKNITFDDAPTGSLTNNNGEEMTISSVGVSNTSHSSYNSNWENCIPDSVLSAYDTKTTITLGQGAVIKNPSSYSVIAITNGANCFIENGSAIECNFNRDVIYMANNAELTFNSTTGTFQNIQARYLVYARNHVSDAEPTYSANAYKINFNGKVSDISVADVIRGERKGEINFNGAVSDMTITGNVIYATDNATVNFKGETTEINANYIINSNNNVSTVFNGKINNTTLTQTAIYANNNCTIDFYGTISNSSLRHAIYPTAYSSVTLHNGSKISDNKDGASGIIYVQSNSNIKVYGEVSGNTVSSDNGGGIYMVHNCTGEMFANGNISNNTVKSSGSGGSGGGVYINHNSTFTMNGGTISENKAEGLYSTDSNSSDYGGGGVSIVRYSKFIMNGGTISNNEANAGGGIWVSGKESSAGGKSSILEFNGGVVKNNSLTDSTNSTYGKEIAFVGANTINSSEATGHYIFVSQNAIIGDNLIGVAQVTSNQLSGYHQAVYLDNKNNSDLRLGTLTAPLETAIANNASITSEVSGYTNTNSSLWLTTQKTSGNVSIISALSDPNDVLNENEYKFIVAALDSSLAVQSLEVYRPSRTAEGLLLEIPVVSGAESYGVVILKEIKTNPLTLTISHEGGGEFYFVSNPSDTSVILNSGDSAVEIFAKAGTGRYIKSIKLTAGDGSVFEKTAVNGLIEVDYYDLAAGSNNIHAVFAVPTGGSGSGTGSATADNGTSSGSDSSGFEESVLEEPGEPVPGNAALVTPTLIILFFVLAVAIFVFVYKRNEEKEEK